MARPFDAKAHLGTGWSFPIRPVKGRLQWVRHEDDIEQAVQIILETEPGERPMLPQFGGGLGRFVFEPNSEATRSAIAVRVRRALVDWEPRIDVERVEVTKVDNSPNVLLIHVDYRVRSTNSTYNRVYPFYLVEG